MTSHNRHGFTLVELMVVIAVIILLVSILLPPVNAVYAVVRQTICAKNLNQIRIAVASLDARDKVSHTGALAVTGWRSQLSTYLSNSQEVMICPEGFISKASGGELAKYAVRVLNGSTFLYNMPLAEGPATLKLNVGDNGRTYDLAFEDIRTSTGEAAGDKDFNDIVLTIQILAEGAKITLKSFSAGYHFYLIDPADKILIEDMGKTGPGVGYSITVPLGSGSKFSYGLNTVVNSISPTASRIMLLDYQNDLASIAGADEVHDNWMTWVGTDGIYKFARHKGRCNIAMVDGSVVPMYPKDIDPTVPELLKKYWKP